MGSRACGRRGCGRWGALRWTSSHCDTCARVSGSGSCESQRRVRAAIAGVDMGGAGGRRRRCVRRKVVRAAEAAASRKAGRGWIGLVEDGSWSGSSCFSTGFGCIVGGWWGEG